MMGVAATSSDYFETDTTMDNRPCHLVISTLNELVVTNLTSVASAKILPQDKDILIYADQLTIHGRISAPGKRIRILARTLSVVAGSGPELSTEPAPRTTVPAPAGSGVPAGVAPTTRAQMANLPKSAASFLANGGKIVWLRPKVPPSLLDESYYEYAARYWANPDGSPGLYPPAKVMPSGLPGLDATTPGETGSDAFIDGLASIRVVATQVELAEKLKLTARGGAGGSGQSGQQGGTGQAGDVVQRPNRGEGDTIDSLPFPSFGGFGGNGGQATAGGNGGKGGRVEVVTAGQPTDKDKFDVDVAGGAPGKDGIPGAGGTGGKGGFLTWPGNLYMQLPKSADGAGGTLKGTPAVKGMDGTYDFKTIDAKPEFVAADNVENLVDTVQVGKTLRVRADLPGFVGDEVTVEISSLSTRGI